jgi:hypothetical protein
MLLYRNRACKRKPAVFRENAAGEPHLVAQSRRTNALIRPATIALARSYLSVLTDSLILTLFYMRSLEKNETSQQTASLRGTT